MSLVDVGLIIYDNVYELNTNVQAHLLDASGEMLATRFHAPRTGNIRKIYSRLSTVTTGQTIKNSLQNIDAATGFPDAGIDQSGTYSVADSDDNTWKSVTLDTDRAVTIGDIVEEVREFDTTVGNLNFSSTQSGTNTDAAFANVYHYTTAWANANRQPLMVVEYDDGVCYPIAGVMPGIATGYAWNSSGSPRYRGMKFIPAFTFVASHVYMRITLATADSDLIIYDGSDNVLTTVTLDKDIYGSTAATQAIPIGSMQFTAGQTYRLVLNPSSVNNVTLWGIDCPTAAALGMMGMGTQGVWTQGSTGSWTETDTRRPVMGFHITHLEVGNVFQVLEG